MQIRLAQSSIAVHASSHFRYPSAQIGKLRKRSRYIITLISNHITQHLDVEVKNYLHPIHPPDIQ